MTCTAVHPDYPGYVCFQNEPEHIGRHMGYVKDFPEGDQTKFWDRDSRNSPEDEIERIAAYLTKTMGDTLNEDEVNRLAANIYRAGRKLCDTRMSADA